MASPQQHEAWRVMRYTLGQIRDEENAKEMPDPILGALTARAADLFEKYDLDDLDPATGHIVYAAYHLEVKRYMDERETVLRERCEHLEIN